MSKKKILVVDDAKFMVAVITNVLVSAGYDVISANSGEQGLELIRSEKPDLVMLDIVMPGLSGFEVLSTIRSESRYGLTPVIVLTGQTEDDDKLRGLELGADDYMTKPFVGRELIARVNNTLVRLERMRGVNPMTGLRGNNEIQLELLNRLRSKVPFAVLYFDLDSFKPYNDVYGFSSGDDVIKAAADIICDSVDEFGCSDDFIGHIGGDDFVAVVNPRNVYCIAKAVIRSFDSIRERFYSPEDYKNGYIVSEDRMGEVRRFPIVAISIAIVFSDIDEIFSSDDLSERAANLKKRAKKPEGSSYATSTHIWASGDDEV